MLVGLALPMLPTRTGRAEQRLYWAGSFFASVSAFLVLYPPDWRGGLIFSGVLTAGLVFRAYMTRSYIRFRGRTYAFNLRDSLARETDEHTSFNQDPDYDPAPDSYAGFATAAKMWWLFVVVVFGCSFLLMVYVTQREGSWYAFGAAAVIVLVAVFAGNQDASWDYGIARGQWSQFAIAGIATLGVFTALYYLTYTTGKRWPWRPKRSLEYQAHPHLRKKYP